MGVGIKYIRHKLSQRSFALAFFFSFFFSFSFNKSFSPYFSPVKNLGRNGTTVKACQKEREPKKKKPLGPITPKGETPQFQVEELNFMQLRSYMPIHPLYFPKRRVNC